jgi:phosphoglycerol transferase
MTLIAPVGGLCFTVAVAGFSQIRGWDRMAVVIGFLALAALALTAEARLPARGGRRRSLAAVAAVGIVVAVGLFDQVPGNAGIDYETSRAYEETDRRFIAQMEQALPSGAMVFQLPVVPFPETASSEAMGLYDHLRGFFLGSNGLRWSSGGIEGRISDWQSGWVRQPSVPCVTVLPRRSERTSWR